jgi:polysaccharide chain length determinant protein (PEP-CTERM system associated)
MEELVSQITGYLRGMWRFRWWGLALAWIVGIVAGVVIYKMPDKYESSARVFVDTQSVLRPLMAGLAVQPNVDQQIAMLSRTLISRPNVEKLITMADLDLGVNTPEQRVALITQLSKDLRIGSADRTNLFTLSYADTRPERAQRVVQSLLSLFVESGLGSKRQDADAARRFIEEQIRGYEQKLTEAENRVKEFRLRNNRYAQNLSELKDGGRIDAETARGVSNGYVFKLRSGGARNWTFDARPMSGAGRFFYCDETGTIRAEAGVPAHQESPVVRESP